MRLQDPGGDLVVRADLALAGQDAEHQRGDGLGDGVELVVVGAVEPVAVALEDELVVLHHEEAADIQLLLPDPLGELGELLRVDADLGGPGLPQGGRGGGGGPPPRASAAAGGGTPPAVPSSSRAAKSRGTSGEGT